MDSERLLERITLDPELCHGKPCVRGLRYPVETILEPLSSGMSVDEPMEEYEDLEREDVYAALLLGGRPSRVKSVHMIA